jgi:hypothetical protein
MLPLPASFGHYQNTRRVASFGQSQNYTTSIPRLKAYIFFGKVKANKV